MNHTGPAPLKMSYESRLAVGLVGGGLMCFALNLHCSPPLRVQQKFGPGESAVEKTTCPADGGALLVVALTVGALLVAFGVNGLAVTLFKYKDVELKMGELDAAKQDLSSSTAEAVATAAPPLEADETPSPEPAGNDVGTITVGEDELRVFPLGSVPLKVFADVWTRWPKDAGDPPDKMKMDEFEYAARKMGKGNAAWLVKFRNRPRIRVGYGRGGTTTAVHS